MILFQSSKENKLNNYRVDDVIKTHIKMVEYPWLFLSRFGLENRIQISLYFNHKVDLKTHSMNLFE